MIEFEFQKKKESCLKPSYLKNLSKYDNQRCRIFGLCVLQSPWKFQWSPFNKSELDNFPKVVVNILGTE